MKTVVSFAALAAGVAATGFRNVPSFPIPANTDNKCNDVQKPGFSFEDLAPGPFGRYGDFDFKGFTCGDFGGKRFNRRTGQKFIGGLCGPSKQSSPSFGCGPKIPNFSLGSIRVEPEFDCDLEFHYDMPDGSTCKHRNACKKSGTTVVNSQCGGARNVTIVFPPQPNKPKPACSIVVPTISFDCNPPKTVTKPATTTSAAPTAPTLPPPVITTKPTVPPPVDTKPTVPPPAETKPPGPPPPPVDTKPTVPPPAETKPPGPPPPPVDTKPTVPPPAETKPPGPPPPPVDTKPTVPPPAETKPPGPPPPPVDTKPTVPPPAETKPPGPPPPPVDTKPTVPPPAETKPPGPPPPDTTTTTTPPVDTLTTTLSTTEITQTTVTTFQTTSTIFSTVVSTITSCGPEVPVCPGNGATTVIVTVPISTTICPVTETQTNIVTSTTKIVRPPGPPGPPGTVRPPPPPPNTDRPPVPPPNTDRPPVPPPNTDRPPVVTPTGTFTTSTTTGSLPVETLPCPNVVPACLNTFMFLVNCKDNSDHQCYCPDSAFVKSVFDCLYSHGQADEIISEAVSFFQGLCAPFIPRNPEIGVGATITKYLTITAPVTRVAPVYTTVVIDNTIVVPVSDDRGIVIPNQSTTVAFATTIAVPQVGFQTESGFVGVIPVTQPPQFVEAPTRPVNGPITAITPGFGGPTRPAVVTAGSGRVSAGLGLSMAMAVLAVAAM